MTARASSNSAADLTPDAANASPPAGKTAAVKRARAPGLSRDKILMVATRMFAEEGFSATSVRDIANECGITLPSIYHFFGDKESLYKQCVAEAFSGATERVNAALAAGHTPKERLQQVMIAVCDMLLNNDNLRRLLQRAMLRRDFHDLEGMAAYFPNQFQAVTEDIGKLTGAEAPAEKAFALYALSLGLVQYRPVGDRVGIDSRKFSTPVHLAEYCLKTILPELR